jgi:hypothetical protein
VIPWLRSERVDLKAIGLFALIQPEVRVVTAGRSVALPVLGRRRGWCC